VSAATEAVRPKEGPKGATPRDRAATDARRFIALVARKEGE